MANLVTRLYLDDKQFNDNINKSKQQLKTFEATTANVGNVLKNMAVGIGIVSSAGEVFNKMLQNSQTFGDNMAMSIEAAKGSVNEFFYALGTGDFSNFLNGINNIIEKAKDAQAALDQLGNAKISYSFVRGENRREIANAKKIANDKNLKPEERETAYGEWKTALDKSQQNAKNLESDIIKAVKALSSKNTRLKNPSIDSIKRIARLDITNDNYRTQEKQRLTEQYDEYKKREKELIELQQKRYNKEGKSAENYYKSQREMDALVNQYSDAILFNNLLVRKNDEEWGNVVNMLIEADTATEELGSQFEEYTNSFREFNNSNNNIKVDVEAKEGSIQKLEDEIKDIKKRILYETDPESRQRLNNELRELEEKKRVIEISLLDDGSVEKLEKQITNLKAKILYEVDPTSRQKLFNELQQLEEKKRVIEFQYKFPKQPDFNADDTSNLADLADKSGMQPTQIKTNSPITDKDVKTNNNYLDSLNGIANIMGSITNMTNEGAAAWLTWTSNLLTAIASAIPAIISLTSAKKGEAATNAVASATETPVVGWLLAGAAVASVLAALASIPKFASGGIVGGNSWYGDKVIARVNSGEMILNHHQQMNLFRLLNSQSVNSNQQIYFKVQGKELVAVLNNYNSKINKLR